MVAIQDNLRVVREAIAAACSRSGRSPQDVRLIAVTKSQTDAVLPDLLDAGVKDIGENRLDHAELMKKSAPCEMRIHAIGRLQGRQIPRLLQACHTVHSLCDPTHLTLIGRHLAQLPSVPDIFVQVNTSQEAQKAGLQPIDLPRFLDEARAITGIRIVGLMTMAPDRRTGADDERIRACFASLARLAKTHGLPRLSMGMSQDFSLAIQEGATDVRIGTRLFV